MTPLHRWWRAGLAATLVIATSAIGLWAPADGKLQEWRFAATDRSPSGDIVFVDIDSASLMRVGVWPWPRSLHGQVLDRLMALGAYEVAFDIDFSTTSNPAEDAAFARSLEAAGGYAYLAAFRQLTAAGAEVLNAPIPEFARHARSVLVNVDSLENGAVRAVPATLDPPGLRSIASTFSPDARVSGSIRIDYGIDLGQVPRIPVRDVLDGTVDPALVRDKQIVVGASAIELNDRYETPRFGILPGPLVQIAAAETLRQDRPLIALGMWPALLLTCLLLLAGVRVRTPRLGPAFAGMLALMVSVEAVALLLLAFGRIELATMPLHVAAAAMLLLRLLEERALRRRQLDEQQARLAYLATHDVSTGALSRLGWLDAAAETLAAGTAPQSILLLKLERLEAAAASLGFELSEAVTALVHARLVAHDAVLVGRIESDIFALLRPTPPSEAETTALLAALAEPYDCGGHRVVLDLRWGLSRVADAEAAERALQQARMALAVATRDRLPGLAYGSGLAAALDERRGIDLALRDAIGTDEFDLVFQPQLDMRSRRTSGVEALVRWTRPDHGLVSPASFIPLAEENGTIVQIGAWVAHEACRRAVACNWPGLLAINVSPIQFQRSDVVAMLQSALASSGFDPRRLVVEITESLLIEGEGGIVSVLHRLRAMGITIAVDDFGTGYSALSYLSDLPVDKLKIDQSFVRRLATDRGAGVIEAIVALGKRLDLEVVVEGVETLDQLDYLASLGCDTAQGYLLGKPAGLPELMDALERAA